MTYLPNLGLPTYLPKHNYLLNLGNVSNNAYLPIDRSAICQHFITLS
jgi:hypothetical protein